MIFIATGPAYSWSTVPAAESVRRHNPDLPIILYTDEKVRSPAFTAVEAIDNPHRRSKVDYLWRSPFARTLYLDSDTRVVADIGEMFDILEKFDLAVAHVRNRHFEKRLLNWKIDVPRSFPQHNCGVLLYRTTPKVVDFLKAWQIAYAEAGFSPDQITFRELLWASELRYYVLPPEYNMRDYHVCDRLFRRGPPVRIWHLEKWQPHKSMAARLKRRAGF
ncbi:MAG: hypothetical protein U1E46_02310 [Hyphomicrobiales bacterium]